MRFDTNLLKCVASDVMINVDDTGYCSIRGQFRLYGGTNNQWVNIAQPAVGSIVPAGFPWGFPDIYFTGIWVDNGDFPPLFFRIATTAIGILNTATAQCLTHLARFLQIQYFLTPKN